MMRISCVICTDSLNNDLATTSCGHVFHYQCLSEWLAHSKTCPQCREKCANKSVIKLYLDSCASEEDRDLTSLDSDELKRELSSVRLLKKEQEETLEKTKKELKEIREELAAWQYQCTSACDKLQQQKNVNSMMKREIIRLENEQKIAEKAAEETSRLRRRLKELKTVEDMLEGSESEVEDMVRSYNDSATELAKFLVVLKQYHKNYESLKCKKMELQSINSTLTLDLSKLRKAWRKTNDELVQSQNDLALSREEVRSLDRERSSLQQKVVTLQEAVDSPSCRTSLKRMLESPAPEHVLSKKQHNGDLLKELFPDSDEENDPPFTSSSSSVNSKNTDCNSSLMASLGIENNVAITSFSAKKRKEFAHQHSSQDNVLVPIQTQSKTKPEFRKTGYNGLGGQAAITILPKSGKQLVSGNMEKNKKLKFGGSLLTKRFTK